MTEGEIEPDDLPWTRLLVGLLGVAIAVVAVVTAGSPGSGLLAALRSTVGDQYSLVMGFGAVAAGLGVLVFLTSRDSVRIRHPPAVEQPTPAPEPGQRFDEHVDKWVTVLPVFGRQATEAARERLRELAVRVVAADEDWQRSTAATAVRDGSWTGDPVARRFLATDGMPRSVRTWLRAISNGETPLRYRSRRTLEAIARRHEETP